MLRRKGRTVEEESVLRWYENGWGIGKGLLAMIPCEFVFKSC